MRELAFDDLVLCAGTVSASGLKERVQAAAAAGYTGISVFADDYDRARADGLSDADLRALECRPSRSTTDTRDDCPRPRTCQATDSGTISPRGLSSSCRAIWNSSMIASVAAPSPRTVR